MIADDRRLLDLLAESAEGCTDALLTAHGFKLDVLISIVSAEFATANPERTFAAGKPVEVTCGSPRRGGGRWRITGVATKFSYKMLSLAPLHTGHSPTPALTAREQRALPIPMC